MAGHSYVTAAQINADAAGVTSNEVQTPTAHPASPVEVRWNHLASDVGHLGFLFGHDFSHQVATDVQTIAEGMTSALGGIIRPHHVAAVNGPLVMPSAIVWTSVAT